MEELNNETIKIFLENAPVYKEIVYRSPKINRSGIMISQVDGYCNICRQTRPFKSITNLDPVAVALRSRGAVSALTSGHTNFEFKCLTCGKTSLLFSVVHIMKDGGVSLQKIGEFPRKRLERDPLLQKFFVDDAEYYEKAIVCLAQGYGIGAFCYFRRIVENNIYRLLELLKEDLEGVESNNQLIENIEKLKNATPMSDRIELANSALPEYLMPSGANPLGRLYATLSEGVHADSDEVCLKKSESIEKCLKYLISELHSRKKNRDSFASIVGDL